MAVATVIRNTNKSTSCVDRRWSIRVNCIKSNLFCQHYRCVAFKWIRPRQGRACKLFNGVFLNAHF